MLDRADATAPSLHQPIIFPDPFRDVIKTEPAPDLPSLIEDMIPYLVEHGITTSRPSTTSTLKPLQANFDFVDKLSLLRPPYRPEEDPTRLITKNKYNLSQDGHIKEAIASNYNTKETEQTLDRVSETIPKKIASSTMDHTTKKQEEHAISSFNTTNSDLVKLNTSQINDANISSESKLGDSLTKVNNSKFHSTTIKPSSGANTELDEPIFSLDTVLDLLFSSDTSNNENNKDTKTTETSTTSRSTANVSDQSEDDKLSSKVSEKMEDRVTETGTPSKVLENEIPMSVASLLKLAGCNIYGRMYRVGRIITELSGPCLECRCTEIGVQCKQLKC